VLIAGNALAFAQEADWGVRGPYVDEILLPIIADDEAQLLALLRGDIHVLPGRANPAHLARLEAEPNVDVTVSPCFHMSYLACHMRKDPLDDIVVLRARAHVVDRDEIIFSLCQGCMLPLAAFVQLASPSFNPDGAVAEYDPELAAQI